MSSAPDGQPPTEIAVTVVLQADKVLIGPRPAGATLEGFWEFPGGKVQPGETPSQTAVRECQEETGLAVRVGRLLTETEHAYPHGRVRLWFFEAEPIRPEQTPRAPFRWVRLAELVEYRFPEANRTVLAQLAGRVRRPP